METSRPAGFKKQVWNALYIEAEKNKAWALDIIKNQPEWSNSASDSSIQMLGSYLYLSAAKLAKEAYLYLEMRAHGDTGILGALDPSARERWLELGGSKITSKNVWKYDHRTLKTSSTKTGKNWS